MESHVTISSLKQAISIRSQLQGARLDSSSLPKPSWTQLVICTSTEKILSELPKERALSPLEVTKQFGLNSRIAYRKEASSRALTSKPSSPYLEPASTDCILSHLMRVTALLPIKGTTKDSSEEGDVQTTFILMDYTRRLHHYRVTELDLFFALEELMTSEEFFPSYAKLHKKIFGKPEPKEEKKLYD